MYVFHLVIPPKRAPTTYNIQIYVHTNESVTICPQIWSQAQNLKTQTPTQTAN